MERSPEVLRSFYLIAIKRDSASSLVNGTSTDELNASNSTVTQKNLGVETQHKKSFYSCIPSDPSDLDIYDRTDKSNISLDQAGNEGFRPKAFLRIVKEAAKSTSCRHCRLYQFHCDRQTPSCFKCERYSLPCYYEDEPDYDPPAYEPSDLEIAHIPWEESAKLNPYQRVGGTQKLHRINRLPAGPRRGRLSKPVPIRKHYRPVIDDFEKEEWARLLLNTSSSVDQDVELASICSSPVSSIHLTSTLPADLDIQDVSVCSSEASSVHTISRPTSSVSQYGLAASVITFRPASEPTLVVRPTSPTASEVRPATLTITEPLDMPETAPSETSEVSPVSRPTSPAQQIDSRSPSPISRPISVCSAVSSASVDSSQSLPTEPSTRRSLSILTTPPTTGASDRWLPPMIEDTWEDIPKSFQCTFCLQHCSNQAEWESHEVLHHTQRKVWVCMPNGPVERSTHFDFCVFCGVAGPNIYHGSHHSVEKCFYEDWHRDRTFITKESLQLHLSVVHHQKEMTPNMHRWFQYPKDDEWYWNCGFCDLTLSSWTKRAEHIAAHFNEGATMSYWDPMSPPYPVDRTTMSCAAWFPSLNWDAKTVWQLRTKRSGWSWTHSLEEQYLCKHCDVDVYFRTAEEAERHENIWHSPREVWSCPTIEDIASGSLSSSFFPRTGLSTSSDDSACPFCGRNFIEISNLYPDVDDIWDIRVRHLILDHNFNCESSCKFTSADRLFLHLANIHNMCLIGNTASRVLGSCKKDERELAAQMIEAAVK